MVALRRAPISSYCLPLLIMIINFSPTVQAWQLKRAEDNLLLAYDPIAENYGQMGSNVATGAAIGAVVFSVFGPFGTVFGSFVGAALGGGAGLLYTGGKNINCEQKCSPKFIVCLRTKKASAGTSCCAENFKQLCVKNFLEIEAMFTTTTTTTTTTTPTPAPIIATFIPNWMETFGHGNDTNTKGFPIHDCQRGRKTTTSYANSTNNCLFDASGCIFVFCYDVKFDKEHFAEWGCNPASNEDPDDTCRAIFPVGYNKDDKIWNCYCEVWTFDDSPDMGNSEDTFEYHYNRLKKWIAKNH